MATVSVHSLRFASGQAVRVYNQHEVEYERRTGRAPMKQAAVTDGVFDATNDCEITADPGNYALVAVTNEAQTVTIDATGGTFTLTYGGDTTGNIAFDALAQAVEDELVALDSLGATDVVVTGSAGGPYTVTFRADLGGLNVAEMTADDANLTGGAGTAVVATATGGSPGTGNPWLLFKIPA